MKVYIIIPCFNEENTIELIIKKVQENKIKDKKLIVIDDGSYDNTSKILTTLQKSYKNLEVLTNNQNFGKGYCIRLALKKINEGIVLIQDADLEYSPSEHLKLLNPIFEDKADIVYGSRFFGGSERRVLYFYHRVANFILTMLSNLTTNLDLTDMETCFKAFKYDMIKNIDLKENRFGFEPEITSKISKLSNCRVYEVGISYNGRKYEDGKKIKLKDAFVALYCIFRYWIFD